MDDNNIFSHLPQDILHQIFTRLSLQQVVICRSVNKHLYSALSSPSFTHLLATTSPFPLLALRPPHRHHPLPPSPLLHLFDPISHKWLRFPLNFLPFPSAHPIASAAGLLYLWADSGSPDGNKSLVVCNPLALRYKTLPQLGSAWSKHGSVLVDSVDNRVIVLNELALLYYSNIKNMWLKFSSNLPAKPRSPVLINKSIIALCDVGSPWRSQWKLFICSLKSLQTSQMWNCLERWGNRVCFSGKRVGRLALWEAGEDGKEEWRWIDGVPGNGEGLYRGFLFDARLDAEP
ncbi:putative F-box domain, kelch-type beta propeller, F-box-like domain superfamily [Helianthus annuus]|nr:putative F-box domain, kelch-type beta propeller, F-box-like domain superfamily [Helianthus annuus]KAJ0618718.1 putative F-box domain, kelch-type beta propeller, F-box-like domain superfamily [Helianthus annuus]KAJ0777171.1 putative F-box domain, kelch-type beta propeller, F-box-like domain superfamily [Helianthus annuus]